MKDGLKYKLIVCDFDGTLCRSDNTVSEYSRSVIEKYFARGGIFTLSSGRNTVSIRRNLKVAGLLDKNIPLLGLQGSVIEDNLSGNLLYEIHLDKDKAIWFSEQCTKRGLYHHVYTRNRIFSSEPCVYSDFYTRMTGCEIDFVGGVTDFIRGSADDNFIKIFAVAEHGKNVELCREIGAEAPSGTHLFTSGPVFFECINPLAGKGNGLRKIAALLNIDMSETMAFGDEMNDQSMIEAAALGVAVENARQELKDSADIVAPSNDLDGVAKTIEKYCL